ncbi:hypothetical protein IFM89_010290, partial [Coptis chinensis]
AGGIPVIDLSPLNNSELSNDQQLIGSLVSEIGNACKDWGFFQVINHGVHSDLQKRIELVARKFFGLSTEEKRKVALTAHFKNTTPSAILLPGSICQLEAV